MKLKYKKPKVAEKHHCTFCNSFKHESGACPNLSWCDRCGEKGHFRNDCPHHTESEEQRQLRRGEEKKNWETFIQKAGKSDRTTRSWSRGRSLTPSDDDAPCPIPAILRPFTDEEKQRAEERRKWFADKAERKKNRLASQTLKGTHEDELQTTSSALPPSKRQRIEASPEAKFQHQKSKAIAESVKSVDSVIGRHKSSKDCHKTRSLSPASSSSSSSAARRKIPDQKSQKPVKHHHSTKAEYVVAGQSSHHRDHHSHKSKETDDTSRHNKKDNSCNKNSSGNKSDNRRRNQKEEQLEQESDDQDEENSNASQEEEDRNYQKMKSHDKKKNNENDRHTGDDKKHHRHHHHSSHHSSHRLKSNPEKSSSRNSREDDDVDSHTGDESNIQSAIKHGKFPPKILSSSHSHSAENKMHKNQDFPKNDRRKIDQDEKSNFNSSAENVTASHCQDSKEVEDNSETMTSERPTQDKLNTIQKDVSTALSEHQQLLIKNKAYVKKVKLQSEFYECPRWASMPESGLRLDVMKGGEKLKPLQIDRNLYYLFGRGKDVVDFHLEHISVSRAHFALTHDGKKQQVFIYDLGSKAGTRVNGKRIQPKQHALLEEGAMIDVGDSSRHYLLRRRSIWEQERD